MDDGLLIGSDDDPRFVALRKSINGRFNIKEWQHLEEGKPLSFLGVELHKEQEGLSDRMDKYVAGIEVMPLPKGKLDQKLNAAETSQFRRLIMRMRWPAQHCMPQMLYYISKLAQEVNCATIHSFKEALATLQLMKEEALQGRARLWYRKIREGDMAVVTFFDASLGKEDLGKSQLAAMHFVASKATVKGPAPASVTEFNTNKSTRVVRSSMAAEACSMCLAADKHLYMRLILHMLLTGDQQAGPKWREKLKVLGYLVTDAKSLYDHMTTTGQIPTERQTLLDLLVCKDLIENDVVNMKWVRTFKQFADFMTKRMAAWLWEQFMKDGLVSLRETEKEAKEEEHRRGLRKAQRQRRKDRLQALRSFKMPAAPKLAVVASTGCTNSRHHQHSLPWM